MFVFTVLLLGTVACNNGGGDPAMAPETDAPTDQAAEEPRDSTQQDSQFECRDADTALVEGIASGLTVHGGGALEQATAVTVVPERRNDQGWPETIIAAQITGEGMDGVVGAWATAETGGPIMAIDTMAREFSDWGAAAQPGSRAADVRDTIADFPEVEAAKGCVEEGL